MISPKPLFSKQSSGLTLVEILVILSILAILAGISGTALMKYLPRADLKYAARTIASLCQHARMEAIKRNAPVALVFSDTDQSCTLYIDSGDGDWSTLADNVAARHFALSEIKRGGVSFSSLPANKNFVFNTRGRLNPPSRTIELSAGSLGMKITVLNSGSVRTEWL
ncbi:MAG: GspH/FimT family pseudopilin [Desulfomicrobium sp.]|nr:GspH/FimT family pseudopilin [Desulfomicrobium sp.]